MPSRLSARSLIVLVVVLAFVCTALPAASGASTATVDQHRQRLEDRASNLAALPIVVQGTVLDESGPLSAARVTLGGTSTVTNARGEFVLRGVQRQNALVDVASPGHVGRTIAVQADRPANVSLVDVGAVTLARREASTTAIAFGGDVSLGRRYLDPSGSAARDEMPANDPEAVIRIDHARADTAALLQDLERVLAPYDVRSLNLETVVTDDPREPQASQRYVFFTLPESAAALADLDIDYMSLGNNHVWDYGTAGVRDTARHLDELGVLHSGSGLNEDEAFIPAVVTSPTGTDFVMHSWVATRPVDEVYAQHATEERAGGADASDGVRVREALAASARRDAVSVAHVHTGIEYTEQPVDWDPNQMVQTRLGHALDGGADLVVAHHPHVAQGYAYEDGVLVAHSLGNLVFDQDRLDTRYGALLSTVFDGTELRSARVDPIHIADYRPTLGLGEPADLALRTWSEAGARDVVLAPDATGAHILERDEAVRTSRTVTVELVPDDHGVAHVDLRGLRRPGESIGAVVGIDADQISLGRDLMLLGGMEDLDLDDDHDEATGWSYGSSSMSCPTEARRGSGALCSFRSPANAGPSTIRFGSRIRVLGDRLNQPHRDISLLVWEAGLARGDLSVQATWMVSQGSTDFGTQELARLPERTGDWLPHWISIPDPGVSETVDPDNPFTTIPLNEYPRALRIALEHEPPAFGDGYAVLDDLALISWHPPTMLDGRYLTPSPYDFVRVSGVATAGTASEAVADAVVETLEVTIELDSWSADG